MTNHRGEIPSKNAPNTSAMIPPTATDDASQNPRGSSCFIDLPKFLSESGEQSRDRQAAAALASPDAAAVASPAPGMARNAREQNSENVSSLLLMDSNCGRVAGDCSAIKCGENQTLGGASSNRDWTPGFPGVTAGETAPNPVAKATEGKAGMAGASIGPVRRSTAGSGLRVGEASADLPATSEHMDATAGETAPNSFPHPLDIPDFLLRRARPAHDAIEPERVGGVISNANQNIEETA